MRSSRYYAVAALLVFLGCLVISIDISSQPHYRVGRSMSHKKAQQHKKQIFQLHTELRSRAILSDILEKHPSVDLDYLARQYGIRVMPELDSLSIRDIELKIQELEYEYKYLAMTYPEDLDYTEDKNLIKEIYLTQPDNPDLSIPYVTETAILESAKSVVAIVKREALTQTSDGWELEMYALTDVGQNLCSFSQFYGAAVTKMAGTGFLVAPDIIATAGHVDLGDLSDVYFLFDYTMESEDQIKTVFSNDDVYEGAEILIKANSADQNDWALVKLTRTVVNRLPLGRRSEGKIASSEKVYMIGHPYGMPMKFSGNAPVINNQACHYFTATLNSYKYNSGSPVFNEKTNMVEGIMTGDLREYSVLCEDDCYAPAIYEPQIGIPGGLVTRSFLFSWYLERPAHVVINSEIDFAMVKSGSETHYLFRDSSIRIPWDAGYPTVQLRNNIGCTSTYDVLPGEKWDIVMQPIWGIPVLQKVCPE